MHQPGSRRQPGPSPPPSPGPLSALSRFEVSPPAFSPGRRHTPLDLGRRIILLDLLLGRPFDLGFGTGTPHFGGSSGTWLRGLAVASVVASCGLFYLYCSGVDKSSLPAVESLRSKWLLTCISYRMEFRRLVRHVTNHAHSYMNSRP